DRRNRHQLVPGAGVRFRLTQVRYVDDRRQARGQSREQIDEADATRHGNAGVSRALGRKAYGVKAAADDRAVQQQEVEDRDCDQRQRLRRQNTEQITLSEKQKLLGESGVVVHAARHSFGQSAKERKGSERDDQRRQIEPRDQQRVQPAAEQP